MCSQSAASETALELLEFLQRPSSYPHDPESVEIRETHISWVFLAGRYAYKLKKPVRFDFLDFSTCELRRQACQAELRLNRRLSPSVYLAVVPICRHRTGRLSIGGEQGVVADWLVKMRRLDDDRTLESLLSATANNDSGNADGLDGQISALADHLAQFYATQAPVTVRTTEFREQLRRHVDENEHQLLQIAPTDDDGNLIRRIHSSQKRFLVTHHDTFDNRVRDGRIVDGHGDLRPDHVYLYNRPFVIDCIEFNAEYRANDIADELAFLAMECDRLGSGCVGRQLFDAYTRVSQDIPSNRLVAFYKSYRACVRAKVLALRSKQQRLPNAKKSARAEHEYLKLAEGYTRDIGPRLVLTVGGLMGTGKSTLADQLKSLLSAEVVSSDVIRQGVRTTPAEGPQPFGEGDYSPQIRLQTYQAMVAAARETFDRAHTVILDATFATTAMRQLAAELAMSCDAKLLQVECTCPRDVAISRIKERMSVGKSTSEALPEHYDQQAAESDPPLSNLPQVNVDTTLALGRQEAIVMEQVELVIG